MQRVSAAGDNFWKSYQENQATKNSSYDLPYNFNLRFVPENAFSRGNNIVFDQFSSVPTRVAGKSSN
jgi:hypothetical protein